jgi:hypothetical protein
MAKLVDLVKMNMSTRQRDIVERIDAENFDLVVYKTRKSYHERGLQMEDEFYVAGVLALKQYYTTAVFDPHNLHAVSEHLDRFWHEHILDTARYEVLCRDMKAFMHHDPLDRSNLPKVAAIAEVYTYTYGVLSKIYGEENLDFRFYPHKPDIDVLVCRHDLDVETYGSAEFTDVFPVDESIARLKAIYGNRAKVAAIKAEQQEKR